MYLAGSRQHSEDEEDEDEDGDYSPEEEDWKKVSWTGINFVVDSVAVEISLISTLLADNNGWIRLSSHYS